MSPEIDTLHPPPPARPPNRARSVLRAAGWLSAVALSYLLLLATASLVAITNAPGIINAVVSSYGVEIGRLALTDRARRVEIDAIRVSGEGRDISIARVSADLAWQGFTLPEILNLRVERPVVSLTSLGDPSTEGSSVNPPPKPGRDEAPAISLGRVEIVDAEIDLALPGQPRLMCRGNLDAPDLEIDGTRIASGMIDLRLEDIEIRRPGEDDNPVMLSADEFHGRFRLDPEIGGGQVESARLHRLNLNLRPEDLDLIPSTNEEESASGEFLWTIGEAAVTEAKIDIEGFDKEAPFLFPDIIFGLELEFSEIEATPGGINSSRPQVARLNDVRIDGGTPESRAGVFTRIGEASIEIVPDDLMENGWIESVKIRDPELEISYDRLARFDSFWSANEKSASSGSEPKSADDGLELPVFNMREFSLEGGLAAFDLSGFHESLPRGKAAQVTGTSEGEDPGAFRLHFSGIDIRELPEDSPKFAGAEEIVLRLSGRGLQAENRIEGFEVVRGEVKIGEEVDRIVASFSGPDAPEITGQEDDDAAGAVDDSGPGQWTIGKAKISESRVILEDIAPGLSYVPVEISTEVDNVPLEGRTPEDEKIQRIELGHLALRSVRNSLVDILRLESIFVEFSLAGLFRNEIEKIEIVSPKLYIGEHLFWYIDDFRQDMAKAAEEAGVSLEPEDGEMKESSEPEPPTREGSERIAIIEDALRGEIISDWKIKAIELHEGHLYLAPKGVTLTNLPLPFSTATDFDSGEIDIKLKIAPGDYPFPGLDMTVGGLRGEAEFNYPLKDADNNFVKTFQADWIKYGRDIEIDKISLTVTYDANGMYGKLWAEGYEGDVNGEFNIYIGEDYKWDGWISAVGVDIGEIVNTLIPESVDAKGVIDSLVLVANGEDFSIEKARGDLKLGSGSLHIRAIQELADSLPESWTEWQKSLANAALETFRLYRFDGAGGQLEFKGWKGFVNLLFESPDGNRDLKLNFDSDGDPSLLLKEFVESTVIR